MTCKWGYEGCKNLDMKCYLCSADGFHFDSKIKKRTQTASLSKHSGGRPGTGFEIKSHVRNVDMVNDVSSRMTPNSGAGKVKGDEEIRGIINIMEELKQQNKLLSRGDKSFSIKRSWLEKLEKEGREANKEFWYLRISYGEEDPKSYVVIDEEMLDSMVYTIIDDRRKHNEIKTKINVIEKREEFHRADNLKLEKEIDYLKALLVQNNIDFK